MGKQPFFSIVIPTYNRCKELKRAVTCILHQKFRDYELIVSDNHSEDSTKQIMGAFTDSRVSYKRNFRNLGWIPNLQKAINKTKGKFVLLHGDDDFMLNDTFLSELKNVLEKQRVYFCRANYLSYIPDEHIIFDFHNQQFCDKKILRHDSEDTIVEFIDAIDPFFVTGIVLEGNTVRSTPLMRSEFAPWFPAVYKAIKSHDGFLWKAYGYVATWSQNASYPRYCLLNGKFQYELYFEAIKKRLSFDHYQKFLDKRVKILMSEFPAAKYFTSRRNFLTYALHMMRFDPRVRTSLCYWFLLIFSFLSPNWLLSVFRKRMAKQRRDDTIPGLTAIYKQVNQINRDCNV